MFPAVGARAVPVGAAAGVGVLEQTKPNPWRESSQCAGLGQRGRWIRQNEPNFREGANRCKRLLLQQLCVGWELGASDKQSQFAQALAGPGNSKHEYRNPKQMRRLDTQNEPNCWRGVSRFQCVSCACFDRKQSQFGLGPRPSAASGTLAMVPKAVHVKRIVDRVASVRGEISPLRSASVEMTIVGSAVPTACRLRPICGFVLEWQGGRRVL